MSVKKGYNDLETWCRNNNREYILKEWDYEKNDVLPSEITAHNDRKVWFICPNEHEYFTKVCIRTREKGGQCPYCSGELFKPEYNSLAVWCKENDRENLLKAWSPKNKVTPYDITPRNGNKFWWICEECGCEFERATAGITREGKLFDKCLCKDCSQPYVATHYAALAENRKKEKIRSGHTFYKWCIDNHREDVLEQWSPENTLSPKEVTPCSKERVKWICRHGHEWEQSVDNRRKGRGGITGCPECVHRYFTSFPEKTIAYYISKYFEIKENYRPSWMNKKEIDIFIPSLNVGIEYDGSAWHTDDEKDIAKDLLCIEQGVNLIRIREFPLEKLKTSVCFILSEKMIGNYFDGLPEAIYNILVMFGVNNPDVNIKRDYNDIMELIHTAREHNTLQTYCEENGLQWILDSWHPTLNGKLTPKGFTPFSNKEVWWICPECGHEYRDTIIKKSQLGLMCPKCHAYRNTSRGSTSFYDWCIKNDAKYLLDEWDYKKNDELGIKPQDISYGNATIKIHWIIKGREKQMVLNNRTGHFNKKHKF